MTDGYIRCHSARAARLAAALALLTLAGCAEAGGYGSSVPPWSGYTASDPYHYHCTGNCRSGAGG